MDHWDAVALIFVFMFLPLELSREMLIVPPDSRFISNGR